MKLRFLGANRQVTGSRYLLEAAGRKIMIDCGLYQERCCLERNWAPSPVAASDVNTLLLTHAHLDHCGLIPRFVREGYAGEILATAPSIDLAALVMEDTARIQQEDAAYKKRRHKREGRRGPHPEVALYTVEDVNEALGLFKPVTYDRPIDLGPGLRVCYRDAGHILGSAMLDIEVTGTRSMRVVFSGDLGPSDVPLMHDPATPERADVVVLESTYGDRDHRQEGLDRLAEIVTDTAARGGNLVIPTFAIDRAQDLLFMIGELVRDDRIPRLTVFLDSPMAIEATAIYARFRSMLDDEAQALLKRGDHPFQFQGLHMTRSRDESRAINTIRGSCIILAGSGMCTGGRIKHHLRQNIGRPESTILFTGFQALDTLGRAIVDGATEVRIHGKMSDVRARIATLDGLSAHADQRGLLAWLGRFQTPPGHVFLTHGEPQAAEALRDRIVAGRLAAEVTIPDYLDVAEL